MERRINIAASDCAIDRCGIDWFGAADLAANGFNVDQFIFIWHLNAPSIKQVGNPHFEAPPSAEMLVSTPRLMKARISASPDFFIA
jgi:hypothetical protein